MRYLAICSSTIQVMFVLNLKNTLLNKDDVEVVFTDTLNGHIRLADMANKYHIFDGAYTADSFILSRRQGQFKKQNFIKDFLFMAHRRGYVLSMFPLENNYDALMFCNMDDFTCGVYDVLLQRNPKLKLFLFEDGYSTYCVQGKAVINNIDKNKRIFRRIINKVLGINPAVLNIDGQFLYDPEGMEWTSYFKRIQVEKINPNNPEVVRKLNLLFGVEQLVDTYDEPIIFFEESYRTEGIPINDIDIVNKIASWVGKENIIIKIHPRNKDNVYKKLGYKTNLDTGIPWEIIYLNKPDMENKLLVSVASGSIATPYTMLGKETHSVALVDMKQVNPSGWVSDYYDYLSRNIYKVRPDIFSCPTDENQLKSIVLEFMNT